MTGNTRNPDAVAVSQFVKFSLRLIAVSSVLAILLFGCSQKASDKPGATGIKQITFVTNTGTAKIDGSRWTIAVAALDCKATVTSSFKIPFASDQAGTTSIEAPNWKAQPGWFACADTEDRLFLYDGVTQLVIFESVNSGGTRVFDITTYPSPMPVEIRSRLSDTALKLLRQR